MLLMLSISAMRFTTASARYQLASEEGEAWEKGKESKWGRGEARTRNTNKGMVIMPPFEGTYLPNTYEYGTVSRKQD